MQSSDSIPNFTKCMHKSDLILCYFRRELKSMNWENIRKLLNLYPKHCLLYDHIDKFIETAKKRNIKPQEIVEALMQFSQANNPYYIEKSDFEMLLKKSILSSCTNVTKTMFTRNNTEKSFISSKDVELLKRKIDEYVHNSKEGYVKSKEYGKVRTKVSEWRKEKKVKDGENLVVVDALNYGIGQDRKEWNSISKQFRHVVFATRFPPMPIRDEVIKRYNGNALFCDKLSADDLIILRMAIEFGRQTSLVTNDQYRDHRRAVCNGDLDVEKVWDDFLIDAVYRHKDGNIETHRNFNLRVHKVNGHWILPVLDSEGNSDKIRDLKVFRIALA
ncbi:hypothetical protein GCK72_002349 [Caenorhabditis remanei]|uniref:PRORP domain-containing protein n=1 Tax=Caenorhabditis remanei TaxID=31234 RepID=A0A6A5HQP1_CAERE|nr:hypothetical protein GCK72_002349 [Caenorhabditis remanei]KAF1770530.1 hypothetical protein GCK72_002349 [Caenorhabditis remanei]